MVLLIVCFYFVFLKYFFIGIDLLPVENILCSQLEKHLLKFLLLSK